MQIYNVNLQCIRTTYYKPWLTANIYLSASNRS